MAYEFKATRRVEFAETDMAGIMHYANFFRFMETAEHGFYRSLGFSVTMLETHPGLGWPRVHAECDYKKPLKFDDLVQIHLLVREKRTKAISYLFKFSKQEEPDVEIARGGLTIVCVMHQTGGGMKAVPIPEDISKHIDVAPEQLLA